MNEQIELTLSLAEINQILEALGEQPYRIVYPLVDKIQGQASPQMANGERPT